MSNLNLASSSASYLRAGDSGLYVYRSDSRNGYMVADDMPYRRSEDGRLVVRAYLEDWGYCPAELLPLERRQDRWVVQYEVPEAGYLAAEDLPYYYLDGLIVRMNDQEAGFAVATSIRIMRVDGGLIVIADAEKEGYATAWSLPEYEPHCEVYTYSANPLSLLGVEAPGDELVYGLELESRTLSEALNLAVNKGGFIWKQDSSCGQELVSAPMPLEVMCVLLENMPLHLLTVDKSCGMHVHINRRHLTQRQICLLALLISDEKYSEEIDAMAGRAANSMCKKTKAKTALELVSSNDRYEAVNLTNFSDEKYTVEIRIFAGTDSSAEVIKRLRWVDSLVQFLKSDMASSSYQDYKKWRVMNTLDNYWRFKYVS